MIKTTKQDYEAAEKILLDKHDFYFFKGPWLQRKGRKTPRLPHVEAALVDILLSHDNEGDRVIITGIPPGDTRRLQARLYHIRKHTDPDFLRNAVQEYKRNRNEVSLFNEGRDLCDIFYEEQNPYSTERFLPMIIESTLAFLEDAKKKHPELKMLSWHEDHSDRFKKMVEQTGFDTELRDGFQENFSAASIYMEHDYYDENIEFYNALPLLRESEIDWACHKIQVILDGTDNDIEHLVFEGLPRAQKLMSNYRKRVFQMKLERANIEKKLAEFKGANLGAGVRQDPVFEKLDRIGMFVDPDFLKLVQRIVGSRPYHQEALKAPKIGESCKFRL